MVAQISRNPEGNGSRSYFDKTCNSKIEKEFFYFENLKHGREIDFFGMLIGDFLFSFERAYENE